MPATRQDHSYLSFTYVANANSLDDTHRDSAIAAAVLHEWEVNRTGPIVSGAASQLAWLRIPDADQFFAEFGIEDPSAGPTSAHFEILVQVKASLVSGVNSRSEGISDRLRCYSPSTSWRLRRFRPVLTLLRSSQR